MEQVALLSDVTIVIPTVPVVILTPLPPVPSQLSVLVFVPPVTYSALLPLLPEHLVFLVTKCPDHKLLNVWLPTPQQPLVDN